MPIDTEATETDLMEVWTGRLSEDARRRIGHATPGRDCPACPAPRDAHDSWGCAATGCPMPIALITARPR